MKTFNDIQFTENVVIPMSNGLLLLNNPTLGIFHISVSYGHMINGVGPSKNQYEIALKNNSDSFIQLLDYDDMVGFVSSEEITEFMKLIQTTKKMDQITEYFKDNFSNED
jgi:hypothetical protein